MFQEDTQGFTELAYNSQRNRYAGDDKLLVQFHILPMTNSEKSAQEGRPCYNDVEHVRIMTPGNKDSVVDRPVSELDRNRFRKLYDNWRAGRAELISGTTLEAAAKDPSNTNLRLTASQIEELRYFHITTVEQLASVSDTNAQKFMGIAMMRGAAQKYMEQAKTQSGETWAKAQLAERDAEINALKEAIRDQGEMIKELQVKRPGRPPKANVG